MTTTMRVNIVGAIICLATAIWAFQFLKTNNERETQIMTKAVEMCKPNIALNTRYNENTSADGMHVWRKVKCATEDGNFTNFINVPVN